MRVPFAGSISPDGPAPLIFFQAREKGKVCESFGSDLGGTRCRAASAALLSRRVRTRVAVLTMYERIILWGFYPQDGPLVLFCMNKLSTTEACATICIISIQRYSF